MSVLIPTEMNAIEIAAHGGPEMLRSCRRPVPRPGPGEVLIQVKAAGVNRPDVMQRRGLYPPPPGASDLPGLEVAGIVAALGPDVASLAVGDPVCALLTGGGYAEFCTAAAPLCLPIPVPLSLLQAAALPETFFTVWSNVFERGDLKAGERVLVHGGTGGIGTTALQLCREWGAEVFATASSPEKCRFCERLGAKAIHYPTQDFADRIHRDTQGAGVDLILDVIGGPYLQRNLASLAPDGRLVIIAVQGGPKTDINLLPVFLKRLTITGSTLRPRAIEEKVVIARALRQRAWPMLDASRVEPVIARVFPLAEAAEAHRWLESGAAIGKLLLAVE